jgi:DNA-binding response OmpR family regulator
MTANSKNLRILVVDDNRDAADSLGRVIRLWGHEVQTAYDDSAVDIAPAFRPDVVLLDLAMPRMDGHNMAQRIREHSGTESPLIIAITGFHDESTRQQALESGFDDYLIKPVDLTTLGAMLLRKQADGHPDRQPSAGT